MKTIKNEKYEVRIAEGKKDANCNYVTINDLKGHELLMLYSTGKIVIRRGHQKIVVEEVFPE
jgi:hypothetical protein